MFLPDTPPTSTTMAQRTLAEFVQDLPPELYIEILDYTLAIATDPVTLDNTYKPPVQLQIDRFSRKVNARRYYRNTIFTINRFQDFRMSAKFLASLPKKHVKMVKTIRCSAVQLDPNDFQMQKLTCPTMLAAWFTHFWRIVGAKKKQLFLSIKVPKQDGSTELQWLNAAGFKALGW